MRDRSAETADAELQEDLQYLEGSPLSRFLRLVGIEGDDRSILVVFVFVFLAPSGRAVLYVALVVPEFAVGAVFGKQLRM